MAAARLISHHELGVHIDRGGITVTKLRLMIATTLLFGTAVPGAALAATFTVNSTADPDTGNPANCSGPAPDCSLRDALAAAEADAGFDTIVFAVSDTIYLRQRLAANHPVGIDGGGGTTLRVHQDYDVVIQPDRFDRDGNGVFDDIAVLRPEYRVEIPDGGAPLLPVLQLHGSGSFVRNMTIDASITPQAWDVGVERIDWNSDGLTDYPLTTVQDADGDNRWLVAGGISVYFDPAIGGGQVELRGNTLQYLSDAAIKIENSAFPVVTENTVSVGVFEGIQVFFSGILTVTKNTVSGFRSGVALQYVSGMTVEGNTLSANRSSGLHIEGVNTDYGTNTIKKNILEGNGGAGLTIAYVDSATVVSNEIRNNGVLGADIKGSAGISLTDNKVVGNGQDPAFHGGIRVAEGTGLSYVTGNTVTANSGFGLVLDNASANVVEKNIVTEHGGIGIILLHDSRGNLVSNNKAQTNGGGIYATSLNGTFPSGNTIRDNGLKENAAFDLADHDPICNDSWANNKFQSSEDASGVCVQ